MLRTNSAIIILLVISSFFLNSASAQREYSDPVIEVLPLHFSSKGLRGEGGNRLKEKLFDTQFIALGEDHGFAGAALFAQAIANDALKYGLKYHAVEAGPATIDWFESQHSKVGLEKIAQAHPNFSLAVPFLSNIEDAKLAVDFIGDVDSTIKSLLAHP